MVLTYNLNSAQLLSRPSLLRTSAQFHGDNVIMDKASKLVPFVRSFFFFFFSSSRPRPTFLFKCTRWFYGSGRTLKSEGKRRILQPVVVILLKRPWNAVVLPERIEETKHRSRTAFSSGRRDRTILWTGEGEKKTVTSILNSFYLKEKPLLSPSIPSLSSLNVDGINVIVKTHLFFSTKIIARPRCLGTPSTLGSLRGICWRPKSFQKHLNISANVAPSKHTMHGNQGLQNEPLWFK